MLPYINIYDSFAAKELYIKKPKKHPSLRSLQEIQAFFYMRRTIRDGKETSYMALDEYKKMRNSLPDIFKIMEEAESQQPQAAPEDLKEALLRKFQKL